MQVFRFAYKLNPIPKMLLENFSIVLSRSYLIA
jgi:hypothetical protein